MMCFSIPESQGIGASNAMARKTFDQLPSTHLPLQDGTEADADLHVVGVQRIMPTCLPSGGSPPLPRLHQGG